MTDKGIVQLKLRMREPLRAAVADYAKEMGISMNAAMVDRLERSFRDDAVLEALARIERAIADSREMTLEEARLLTGHKASYAW